MLPQELRVFGDNRPARVHSHVDYSGERPSLFSFFFQFPSIVFRLKGSTIPNVLIEVCISMAVSIVAKLQFPDEEFKPIGHQLVGVLLAFLVVFRSNIAWGMYM